MRFRTNPWLDLAARLFVGGVFIYAGLPKVLDPCEFARSIYAYELFPLLMINITAVIVPWFELICGCMLIAGILQRGAAAIIAAMLCMFLVLLGITFVRGIDFDCGCFAGTRDLCKLLTDHMCRVYSLPNDTFGGRIRSGCEIIRDIVFLIPCLFTLTFKGRRFALQKRAHPE